MSNTNHFFFAADLAFVKTSDVFIPDGMDPLCVLRLDTANSAQGTKLITPIRPVVCLAQPLDVGESTVRLF